MRRALASLAFLLTVTSPASAQQQWGTWSPGRGAFGDWHWASPVANLTALELLTGVPGECIALMDAGSIYCWSGDDGEWAAAGGGGADTDDQTAAEVPYDPTASGLTATDVQAAVDELAADPGVSDHGALTGLADDDHAQYALLAGRSGGQTIYGGTATTNRMRLIANTVDDVDGALLDLLGNGGFILAGSGAGTVTGSAFTLEATSGSLNLLSDASAITLDAASNLVLLAETGDLTGWAKVAAKLQAGGSEGTPTHELKLTAAGALTLDNTALVLTNDARLSDARTPTAHASTHASAGGDPLSGTLAVDVTGNAATATTATTANAGDSATAFFSTGTVEPARLGTGSGGSTKFLREDSTWQTVSAGGSSSGTGLQKGNGSGGFTDTGIASTNGGATIVNTSAAAVPLSVTGAASQSAHFFDITANAGTAGAVFNVATGSGYTQVQIGGGYSLWGAPGELIVRSGSTSYWYYSGAILMGLAGSGNEPAIQSADSSATVPRIFPSRSDTNTGPSWAGSDLPNMVAGGVEAVRWNVAGHQLFPGGTAPTVAGSCGTSPAIGGKDNALKVTTGTGSPTSCTVTFGTAWGTAPVCTANATATAALNVATTTTTVTISAVALAASETIHVICFGY